MSKVVEAVRQGFVGHLSWAITWPALVVLGAMIAALSGLALWILERSGR
jgi:ABC-2 type transport system permease protein